MDVDETLNVELDDDGTAITELLERAESSLCNKDDNKYYATRDEIYLLAAQPDLDRETRIEKDCSGNWVIEVYYSRMIFIHVASCQALIGQTIQ